MSQIQSYPTQKEPRSENEGVRRKSPQPNNPWQESPELAYGQSVIVVARWILVVTGLFLVIWNPDPLGNLRIQVMTIFVLALMNFYLQAQILMRRKTIAPIVYAASVVDFIVITILIGLNGGFDSNTYVFYFPAILAISVAFETTMAYGFIGIFSSLYFLICLGTGGFEAENFPILIARIVMMVAIAFCGNLFWHIEQNRRDAARKAHQQLLAEVRRGKARQAKRTAKEAHDADSTKS